MHETFVPWDSAVRYLGLVLDSRLYTKNLQVFAKKTAVVLCNISPLLTRDSTLTQPLRLTLYNLLTRSILTSAAPVCSPTCPSNYLKLQIIQSKCLRVIGNYTRRTPTSHMHDTLNIKFIPVIIHQPTAKFLLTALHTQPPDPTNRELYYSRSAKTCKKYKHKRPKHMLLQ